MPSEELSKLELVPVRNIWKDEALDFTPWLAENLHQLGEALHLDLELVSAGSASRGFLSGHTGKGSRQSKTGGNRKPIGDDRSQPLRADTDLRCGSRGLLPDMGEPILQGTNTGRP